MGLSDPATLEAMANAESLALAKDIGLSRLRLEVSTDCLEEVIKMMKT
jgi:hypothetical protein